MIFFWFLLVLYSVTQMRMGQQKGCHAIIDIQVIITRRIDNEREEKKQKQANEQQLCDE